MYRTKWITVIAIVCLLSGCGGDESSQVDDPAADAAQSPRAGTDGADTGDAPTPADSTATGSSDDGRESPSGDTVSSVTDPPSPAPSADSASIVALRNCLIDLNSDDLRVRRRGLDLLEKRADAVAQSVAMLKNEPPDVRRGAAFFLLGKFDAGDPQVDQALIGALTDEDSGVRHIALQAVNELQGNAVLPAIGQLARMLANPQEERHIRSQIARRLGQLESGADGVLPTLQQLGRNDDDRDVRAACLYAFYKTAGRDEAIALFREVLREDTDAGLRGVAASRIGSFAAAAAPAVPDLAAALDADKESSVRGKVAEALAKIGSPALPTLTERFNAKDREVRILAIFGAGRMGPAAGPAIPQLERLLKDEDRDVRLAAELSLRRLQGLP